MVQQKLIDGPIDDEEINLEDQAVNSDTDSESSSSGSDSDSEGVILDTSLFSNNSLLQRSSDDEGSYLTDTLSSEVESLVFKPSDEIHRQEKLQCKQKSKGKFSGLANYPDVCKKTDHLGKKKARRLENARQLEILAGGEKSDQVDIEDFMPYSCTTFRFTQLLQDPSVPEQLLEALLDVSEQNEQALSKLEKFECEKKTCKKDRSSEIRKRLSGRDAFNGLSFCEKNLLKRKNIPMGMVNYLDTCVYSFFQNNPQGTYTSEPLSSFERMILHGVAHYYRLHSSSVNRGNDNRIRVTKIINIYKNFYPPKHSLTRFLDSRREGRQRTSRNKKCVKA